MTESRKPRMRWYHEHGVCSEIYSDRVDSAGRRMILDTEIGIEVRLRASSTGRAHPDQSDPRSGQRRLILKTCYRHEDEARFGIGKSPKMIFRAPSKGTLEELREALSVEVECFFARMRSEHSRTLEEQEREEKRSAVLSGVTHEVLHFSAENGVWECVYLRGLTDLLAKQSVLRGHCWDSEIVCLDPELDAPDQGYDQGEIYLFRDGEDLHFWSTDE